MNKENHNRGFDAVIKMMELLDKTQEYLAIIKAATDECDKLNFFADVNRAGGKEQFAKGIEFAIKHVLDVMAKTIDRYEKEGR